MKLQRCSTDSCNPASLSRVPNMDAWFSNPFAGFSTFAPYLDFGRLFTPPEPKLATDVYEDAGNYYARFEVPGAKKDDVKLELNDRQLTVTVNRKTSSSDGESTYTLSRSLTVPKTVDSEKIGAKLEDGLLTVTLPKAEEVKPRTITIN